MNKLLGKYVNGNTYTKIYSDGTKIRTTMDDEFKPKYPENFDCNISTYCTNGCDFCYAGCSEKGKDANLLKFTNIWNNLHPYTEIALNLNSDIPYNFDEFLIMLKKKQVITNITVNQKQVTKFWDYLLYLTKNELVYGIGISLDNSEKGIEELINLDIPTHFPNAVIHTIVGITSPEAYTKLADNRHKVLILGYKNIGRGFTHFLFHRESFSYKIKWLYNSLEILKDKFKVLSFDNLALEQLQVKRLLTPEQWEQFYMGDDGTFTLYVDLVSETFARDSISSIKYPIGDLTIDEMFNVIQKEIKGEND